MKKLLFTILTLVLIINSTFAQESFNISTLGYWPYSYSTLGELSGNYLIANNGRTIQIYNISDPGSILHISELFLDETIIDFTVRDNLVYLISTSGIFMILDISEPTQIDILSKVETNVQLNLIELSGDFAYLHHNLHGIYIYNISDPLSPYQVGQHIATNSVHDMCIYDNKAYMAVSPGGIEVYDISDPTVFSHLGNYDTTGNISKLLISGDSLFALSSSMGVMLLDAENPGNIKLISHTDSIYYGLSLGKFGNTVAATSNYAGVYLFDFSNPLYPELTGSLELPGSNTSIILSENFNCLVTSWGLHSIDIYDPQNITILDVVETSGLTQYGSYFDGIYYTYGLNNPLRVFDVSDYSSPTVLYQETGTSRYSIIYAKDGFLFKQNNSRLQIWDFSSPHSPVLLDSISVNQTLRKITKQNNLLFLADDDSLKTYDIADVYNAILTSSISNQIGIDFFVEENIMYVLKNNGIDLYDITSPEQPILLSNTYYYNCKSFSKYNNLVYISCHDNTQPFHYLLRIIDVSDPSNPLQISILDQESQYYRAITESGFLYLFEESKGIYVYDLSTPELPELCGYYRKYHILQSADIINGNIYIPVFSGFNILHNDLILSKDHVFIPKINRLDIYPNPASEFIRFEADKLNFSDEITYQIISANGSIVQGGSVTIENQNIPISSLTKGIYLLHVICNGVSKGALFQKY